MIHIPFISVFGYGSDPADRANALHVSDSPMFSGSGGGGSGPPKPPKAPIKPKKKPKK